jgi:two-component system, OmpR family, response regulator BaeR
MRKILIVDDDKKITKLLKDYLEQENFDVSILYSGETVVSYVRTTPIDTILLDLMLPGKDGLTICKEIRSFSRVPILIISAKVDEIDRLLGFELGADDYISKPFSPREVVTRTKAMLRRCYFEPINETLVLGPITIDFDSYITTIGGTTLHLTPEEFGLLKILSSQPDRVFTRSDLISKIQGYDYDGYDRTIDSHIKNLRKKIDVVLPAVEIIETIYGVGYRMSLSLSKQLNITAPSSIESTGPH